MLILINSPIEEGILLVRTLMENYGILVGPTIFNILIAVILGA